MKLSIAATILGTSACLLATSSASTGVAGLQEQAKARLRNLPSKGIVGCDPFSMDADIGILSCGTGQRCVKSTKSILGGVCTTDTHHQAAIDLYRRLDHIDTPEIAYHSCNRDDYDETTGSGTLVCSDDCFGYYAVSKSLLDVTSFLPPQGGVCGEVQLRMDNFTVQDRSWCMETVRADNPERVCIESSAEDHESCSASFNGQECSTCDFSEGNDGINCTNVGGGVATTMDEDLLNIFTNIDPVWLDWTTCDFCAGMGDGYSLQPLTRGYYTFGKFGYTDCYGLFTQLYDRGGLPAEVCQESLLRLCM
mmetsp:Transcript_29376/g.84441  ORF Transcript_29376/g.84441 Transcript_29376/m.84441 type:complete len:308 (-) Transcript_29376:498-1421(-)